MMGASRVSANLLTVYDVWRAFGCNFAPPSFLYASAMRTAAASTALAVILALGCGDSGTEPTGLRRVQVVGSASLTHFLVHDTARLCPAGHDKDGPLCPAVP